MIDTAIEDLTAARKYATDALMRANRDADEGITGGGQERVSTSTISDPTAGHAFRVDDVRRNAQRLIAAAAVAQRLATEARRCAGALLPINAEKAQALASEIQGGPAICANPACQATVWRTANDRLRKGRCTACYLYRERHDGTERPRQLCHPEDFVPDPPK